VTGLLNRRATDEQLGSLVSRSRRHAADLAVLIIDVDGFREINGVHGSAVGDEVLEAVAVRVSEELREEDCVGRWGGDEMLVLAPDTGSDGAASLATRIRDAVAAGPVRTEAGAVSARVSVGAVTLEPDEDAEAVVRRAERALEAARGRG
jgi:diguanylate cyclase (GGDEF)-like protein